MVITHIFPIKFPEMSPTVGSSQCHRGLSQRANFQAPQGSSHGRAGGQKRRQLPHLLPIFSSLFLFHLVTHFNLKSHMSTIFQNCSKRWIWTPSWRRTRPPSLEEENSLWPMLSGSSGTTFSVNVVKEKCFPTTSSMTWCFRYMYTYSLQAPCLPIPF